MSQNLTELLSELRERVRRLEDRERIFDSNGNVKATSVAGVPVHPHDGGASGGVVIQPRRLKLAAATLLTIAGGVVTVSQNHHRIDTESAAASDDLDTVNGLEANGVYVLRPANDARTIVVKHATGNILCWNNGDYTLDDVHDWVWGISPDGVSLYVLGDSQGSGAFPGFGAAGGAIDIGDAASDGVAGTASRSDHQHGFAAPGAGYPVDVAAAEADGVATTPARSDHGHAHGSGYLPDAHHAQSHGNADHTTTGTPGNSAPGDAAGAGTSASVARLDHTHGRESYATIAASLYSVVDYVNVPDAAPAATIVAGDVQGNVLHSGPSNETAFKLFVDAETAPGASGLPVTWQYGDTDDLDTVASWTTIATYTLSSEKSNNTTSMTNATITAGRLIRTNWGTIVGTPKDATTTLRVKRPLST